MTPERLEEIVGKKYIEPTT
ncbi:hypothetical protein P5495_018740 [Bacillus velezensis]